MLRVSLVVFLTCVTLAVARVAPLDETISELNLIRKYRYPIEIHHVTTEDGYILEMHRIPHGRDSNNDPHQKRPVVFLLHGLLSSSSAWVITGPGSAFGYLLAEAGYDVWMGNIRGNTYSRRHVRLNPDALLNTAFWEYSWDEHGNFDLPAMIDYALAHTGRDRLHYVGHSMGTTSFFTMASLRPEYYQKIISMHALAPVAYMAHNRNLLLNAIAPFANNIEPDLITKYRYPIEIHHVTTEDGYILEMHRIPHGRDSNNDPHQKRPVVFLIHGLLSSSSAWVITGPGSAFGYLLAEAGYDVWMGNIRGNTYFRRHVRLNPDALLNTAFWEYSWDEHGNFDLPAMIDYALAHTGRDRLHYVGHSMGTTSFFTMASLRPEYNQKIISMHALAPVAYMAHNHNLLLNAIAPFANNIERIGSIIGYGEFLTSRDVYTWAGQAFCRDEVVFQPICSNILFLIGGWNEGQHNTTIMPIVMGHMPAGASVRQLAHYGQGITGNEFRRYDYGSRLSNRRVSGTSRPPHYDLKRVTTPVFLHYSDNDPLAEVADVQRLFRELGRPIGLLRVPLPAFTHLDFMLAIDAKELIYDRVINLIRAMDINGTDDIDISKY